MRLLAQDQAQSQTTRVNSLVSLSKCALWFSEISGISATSNKGFLTKVIQYIGKECKLADEIISHTGFHE